MPSYIILNTKDQVVESFDALDNQEAGTRLRQKCVADETQYTLARKLRTVTPVVVPRVVNVNEEALP